MDDFFGDLNGLHILVILDDVVLSDLDVGLSQFGHAGDAVTSRQDPVLVDDGASASVGKGQEWRQTPLHGHLVRELTRVSVLATNDARTDVGVRHKCAAGCSVKVRG